MQANRISATVCSRATKVALSLRRRSGLWWLLVIACVLTPMTVVYVQAQSKTAKRRATQSVSQLATRLTGTYRLDPSLGDDTQQIAERATQNLPAGDRQRVFEDLLSRLELPNMLALERRGSTIAIASSRAPRITFIADGVTRTEQLADGRTGRVRAVLNGDQLAINYAGVPGSDYTVTFDLIEAAGRLSVTRRVYGERISHPVVVQSLYERTSDIARWDVYDGSQTASTQTTTTPTTTTTGQAETFIVRDGTTLVAELNDDLSTKQSRERDRFTMTVRSPSEYAGAIIEGYVTNVKRSGKITGRSQMTFNFDRIQFADGRSYKYAGIVENIRTTTGESVKVDNEGAVREGDSRTSTTQKRAAIGTAVGAIVGAIAGGGKGAAIGAIVGAGAGAGSVYVQGADDLELKRGTEISVRTSAPR